MLRQHLSKYAAQVAGRAQVPVFIEFTGFQSRPVAGHAATVHGAAGQESRGANTVIGAGGAVDGGGAAEFRADDDHRFRKD